MTVAVLDRHVTGDPEWPVAPVRQYPRVEDEYDDEWRYQAPVSVYVVVGPFECGQSTALLELFQQTIRQQERTLKSNIDCIL